MIANEIILIYKRGIQREVLSRLHFKKREKGLYRKDYQFNACRKKGESKRYSITLTQ